MPFVFSVVNTIASMTRPRLYFDNAATSFPMPPEVAQAMLRYTNEIGASPGRGSYREAIEAARILTRCRELINRLINGELPRRGVPQIVFTLNASDALNLAIKGFVRHHHRAHPGRPLHIITTAVDHNSVLRPLREVEGDGVTVTRVEVDPAIGRVDPERIRTAIRSETKLLAITHASNVTGVIQPIVEIGAITREREVTFLVDAAQTLGHVPIDVQISNVDLLAFPGHKGLLGPLGTGGLYLRPGMEHLIDTVREGGTGSVSERDVQPQNLPDKYEPGSHNGPGIAGLAASVQWILDRGVDSLREHEQTLTRIVLDELRDAPGIRILGPSHAEVRTGVISFTIDGIEPADAVAILEGHFGVLARSGLHCAPLAHAAYGTAAHGGAIRVSVGPFLTEDDARYAANAVKEVAREAGARPDLERSAQHSSAATS